MSRNVYLSAKYDSPVKVPHDAKPPEGVVVRDEGDGRLFAVESWTADVRNSGDHWWSQDETEMDVTKLHVIVTARGRAVRKGDGKVGSQPRDAWYRWGDESIPSDVAETLLAALHADGKRHAANARTQLDVLIGLNGRSK